MAAAFLAGAKGARGQTPGPAEDRPDAEVSRRLAFIEERFERGKTTARLWWYGWYFGYMALTVGQAAVAVAVKDRGQQVDRAVGAAFSSLGVLGIGITDFPPRYARAALQSLPAGTSGERRRKLAHAERLLADSAKAEAGGRSWVAHVAGVGVTVVNSLVLALAYKRIASSLLTLGGGVAITEAQIFTRPTAAIDDLRAYRQGAWRGSAPVGDSRSGAFRVVAQPGGVGLSAAF
jgi:hypothetical protein